jgi:hypothetical protein
MKSFCSLQTNCNFVTKLGIIMTEDQKKQLDLFETRLHRLIYLCDELKKENADLSASLEMEKAKNEIMAAKIDQLEKKYSDLKAARAISLGTSDIRDSKMRINNLVREIDKCIALMND